MSQDSINGKNYEQYHSLGIDACRGDASACILRDGILVVKPELLCYASIISLNNLAARLPF